MDPAQIGIVAASLSVAKDMTKALLGIRDFNLIAERVAGINDQLLKAQEALLGHNASMFEMQNKYFEASEELRKLKEAIGEHGRYSLFEISSGNFLYRVNIAPQQSGASEPSSAEPLHYLCQPCFDKGVKSVLRGGHWNNRPNWSCSICQVSLYG